MNQSILSRILFLVGLWLAMLCPCTASAQQKDSERLGRALDYFQSGKYHECLVILQDLDKNYRLNPRFRAYLGVCYYYEWDYKNAASCLDASLPSLTAFAPSELSFYYYADAESHFYLEQYDKALPLYEKRLELCHNNEKADTYYQIGVIHLFKERWIPALDNLQNALVYYRKYLPDQQARIAQIRNMIEGCAEKIQAEEETKEKEGKDVKENKEEKENNAEKTANSAEQQTTGKIDYKEKY